MLTFSGLYLGSPCYKSVWVLQGLTIDQCNSRPKVKCLELYMEIAWIFLQMSYNFWPADWQARCRCLWQDEKNSSNRITCAVQSWKFGQNSPGLHDMAFLAGKGGNIPPKDKHPGTYDRANVQSPLVQLESSTACEDTTPCVHSAHR